MEGRGETPDLEEQVEELARLADALEIVPDDELVGTLGRAVELLREINSRIETKLAAAGTESREVGEIIERIDLGPFDEALGNLERQERSAGEP